jgi:NH3-dependent NAD+ synthetase
MPEIPRELVEKAPSDGLTGKTDEDKIGFSYDWLDRWIRSDYLPKEEVDIPEEVCGKILSRIDTVRFKRVGPDQFFGKNMFVTQEN